MKENHFIGNILSDQHQDDSQLMHVPPNYPPSRSTSAPPIMPETPHVKKKIEFVVSIWKKLKALLIVVINPSFFKKKNERNTLFSLFLSGFVLCCCPQRVVLFFLNQSLFPKTTKKQEGLKITSPVSGEQIAQNDFRLNPGYAAYYYSRRPIDPRLPPPLVSPYPNAQFASYFQDLGTAKPKFNSNCFL